MRKIIGYCILGGLLLSILAASWVFGGFAVFVSVVIGLAFCTLAFYGVYLIA